MADMYLSMDVQDLGKAHYIDLMVVDENSGIAKDRKVMFGTSLEHEMYVTRCSSFLSPLQRQ